MSGPTTSSSTAPPMGTPCGCSPSSMNTRASASASTWPRRPQSDDVLARLAQLFVERGPPVYLRSDNGPEFTATAVREWLQRVGVTTLFIEPGSPWENSYVESFNGKAARRVPQPGALRHPPGSPGGHRGLAPGRQPDPAPQRLGLPPPGPRGPSTPGASSHARPGIRTNLTDWYNDRGQVSPTGKPVEVRWLMNAVRLQEDQVIEEWEIFDRMDMMSQLE